MGFETPYHQESQKKHKIAHTDAESEELGKAFMENTFDGSTEDVDHGETLEVLNLSLAQKAEQPLLFGSLKRKFDDIYDPSTGECTMDVDEPMARVHSIEPPTSMDIDDEGLPPKGAPIVSTFETDLLEPTLTSDAHQPVIESLLTHIETKTDAKGVQSLVFHFNTDMMEYFNVKNFLRNDIDFKVLNQAQFCFPLSLKKIIKKQLLVDGLPWVLPHFRNVNSGLAFVKNPELYQQHKILLKKILCETSLFILHNPTYRGWFEEIIQKSFCLQSPTDYNKIHNTIAQLSAIQTIKQMQNGSIVYLTNHTRPYGLLSKHYTNYFRGLAKKQNKVDDFLSEYHNDSSNITLDTPQSYIDRFISETFIKLYFKKKVQVYRETFKRIQYNIFVLSSLPGGFSEELAFSVYDEFIHRMIEEKAIPLTDAPILLCDPSHGWGNRMVGAGALSYKMNRSIDYFSIDPQYKDVPEYKENMDAMSQFIQTKASKFTCHLLGECSENEDIFNQEKYGWYPGQPFDCVFTSPPYYTVETYRGPNQSTAKYNKYNDWLNHFLIKMIDNYWTHTKPGGYFILNVSNKIGKDIETTLRERDPDFETRYIKGITQNPKRDKSQNEPLYILKKRSP